MYFRFDRRAAIGLAAATTFALAPCAHAQQPDLAPVPESAAPQPAAPDTAPARPADASPAPAAAPGAAQAGAAPAAPATADWIDTSKKRNFSSATRVVIPSFRVAFAVKASGSAQASGGFGSRGAASAHGSYQLAGPDGAMMQAITDSAYERFVAALKAGGVEIVPWESLPQAARDRLAKGAHPAPNEFKAVAGRNVSKEFRLYTAKGLPFYTPLIDPVRGHLGLGAQFSNIGWDALDYVESELAGELQATVLRPTLWVDFIDMETGGGFFARNASVSAEPGIKITANSELRILPATSFEKKPKPGGGTVWLPLDSDFSKLPLLGLRQTVQPPDSGLKGVEDTTSAAVAGVQTAVAILSVLTGGNTRRDRNFNVNVDPAKYQAAAQSTLGAIAEQWAKQVAGK